MSLKRKRSEDAPEEPEVFASEPIEDRSSKFIGYFSPTLPSRQLQSHAAFSSPSHKILAWREPGNQRLITPGSTQYNTGHDDDGEKHAGKKIAAVLDSLDVVGACVVARWWGGVMLGPVRFTHIEDCAKGAVRKWQSHQVELKAKRQKAVDDEAEHARLSKALVERDESIAVLRGLASEKEAQVKNAIVKGSLALDPSGDSEVVSDRSDERPPIVTPSKLSVDYASLPVERLRLLEKARDATLAFLLKRIDKADADIAALKPDND